MNIFHKLSANYGLFFQSTTRPTCKISSLVNCVSVPNHFTNVWCGNHCNQNHSKEWKTHETRITWSQFSINNITYCIINFMSFHVVPCNSVSFHVIPCHSVSFRVIPCHSTSFHVIPRHSTSFHLFWVKAPLSQQMTGVNSLILGSGRWWYGFVCISSLPSLEF